MKVLGEYSPLDLSIRDTMEQAPSKHADYMVLLKTLLHSSGVKVKEQNFQELFQAIDKHGHWLDPEKGALRLNEWKEVMRGLRRACQSGNPIPVSVWSLFHLILSLWLLYHLNGLTLLIQNLILLLFLHLRNCLSRQLIFMKIWIKGNIILSKGRERLSF